MSDIHTIRENVGYYHHHLLNRLNRGWAGSPPYYPLLVRQLVQILLFSLIWFLRVSISYNIIRDDPVMMVLMMTECV